MRNDTFWDKIYNSAKLVAEKNRNKEIEDK